MSSTLIEQQTTSAMQLMTRALILAEQGLFTTDPNPRVGCVLVNDGEVVGEGWHQAAGEPHAEINALKQAGKRARGATCYLSLEPCSYHGRTPPCVEALIAAGIKKVVVAMQDPNPQVAGQGLAKLQQAGIDVEVGLLEKAARQLNIGFVHRMETGRPWVRAKLGMSLDGRTAMASGESKWITGTAARQDVQYWRARSSAILTGVGTVLVDNPKLNIRPDELAAAQTLQTHGLLQSQNPLPYHAPWRVIVDSQLRTPQDARLFSDDVPVFIATANANAKSKDASLYPKATFMHLPGAGEQAQVDLAALMDYLGKQEINEVLLEAGPTLSGAMLQANLIDELLIYMAPSILGDSARGLFHLPGLEKLENKIEWVIKSVTPVGDDWCIRGFRR